MSYPFRTDKKVGVSRVHEEGPVDFLTPWGTIAQAPFQGEFRYYKDNLGSVYISYFQANNEVVNGIALPAGTRWDFVHVNEVNAPTNGKHVTVNDGGKIGVTGNSGNVIPKPTKERPYAGSHTHLGIRTDWQRKPKVYLSSQAVIKVMDGLWARGNTKPTPLPTESMEDKHAAMIADLTQKVEKKSQELLASQQKTATLEAEIAELKSFMHFNLGVKVDELVGDLIIESGRFQNIMQRWEAWVDSHVSEEQTRLRSFLKYELFVAIGVFVSSPTVGLWMMTSGTAARISEFINQVAPFLYVTDVKVAAVVVGVCSLAFKLLVTKYDTNQDGKLTWEDTEVLRTYLKNEGD